MQMTLQLAFDVYTLYYGTLSVNKVIPIPPTKPGLTSCQGRRMESLEMLHELRILLELRAEPLLWNLHDLVGGSK